MKHKAKLKPFLKLLAAICLLATPLLAQEIYRWTDENGSVHFTDNIYSVPEKYRDQAQKRQQPAGRSSAGAAAEPEARRPEASAVVTVPFTRQGNLIIVEGAVNGAPVKFILDTGADITIVPQSFAARLGVNPKSGIFITMAGIGGNVDVPLVEADSVTVGDAEVRNLEVTVNETPLPDTGLLGADFLSDYKVNLRYETNEVFLEPVARAYGGHGTEWWHKKFRLYLGIKKRYEQAGAGRGGNEVLDGQLRAVERKLADLEGRASQAGIPREFRE